MCCKTAASFAAVFCYNEFMCTAIRFADKNGNMFFGRNLDWSTGYGQSIITTPKDFQYHSAFLGEIVSKYAVIGMAIVVDDTPLYFDCGNEAGLAIAGLNFPDSSKYEPTAIEGKTNVAQYEFPLWVAMNFSSVDEVEEALKNVAIVAKSINDSYPSSKLHWLIGDSSRSITVEYTDKGMQIYHNDLDVLTNEPEFPEHIKEYNDTADKNPENLPGDWTPPARFLRVAFLNKHYPTKSTEEENVSRLFHTLSGVAIADGAHVMADGSFEKTIYTSCFSSATKTYYWNTYEDPQIKNSPLVGAVGFEPTTKRL